MALIDCPECRAPVSSEAAHCPQCGKRIKPRSKVWLWVLGVPAALFLVMAAVQMAKDSTPEGKAENFERQKYELCLSDLNDPSKSANEKAAIIRPVCERFKAEFRAKYNKEP